MRLRTFATATTYFVGFPFAPNGSDYVANNFRWSIPAMIDKRYQVFVSSTFTDLKEERDGVIRALLEMDCIPAGMELFPAIDEEQFEFIKKVIDDCDYYIIIVAARYGSSISPEGISYTEKEYDYAVSRKIPVLAFLHRSPGSIAASKVDYCQAHARASVAFAKN
jgi:hypothetical protein